VVGTADVAWVAAVGVLEGAVVETVVCAESGCDPVGPAEEATSGTLLVDPVDPALFVEFDAVVPEEHAATTIAESSNPVAPRIRCCTRRITSPPDIIDRLAHSLAECDSTFVQFLARR
jgi:hypothetical protein